jgi:hypothetical protein
MGTQPREIQPGDTVCIDVGAQVHDPEGGEFECTNPYNRATIIKVTADRVTWSVHGRDGYWANRGDVTLVLPRP